MSSSHVVSSVKETSGVATAGAASETHSTESTRLMQFGTVPHSTKEESLSFVSWSFHWIQLEVGPPIRAFERERLHGLDVIVCADSG